MMNTITCPSTNELHSLMLGGIGDPRSEWLFEHVQGCLDCQQEIEALSTADDTLTQNLRLANESVPFSNEQGCRAAVAKALASLANNMYSEHDSQKFTARTIGEYELIRPLGHGGMSAVYLARHSNLGREVAVKLLAKHRLDDRKFQERFEAEMRAVGKLSHPHIVVAHDAREIDGTAVLITEYIRGLDLRKVVARVGVIGVAEAAEIARRLALALAYISSEGFVHRDVKPSNIMLTADGDVKLLDLGLARLSEDNGPEITGSGQTLGTADYIAPEQIHDSRSVDCRADLYGLGCTLYKLLCGHAPFESESYGSVVAKLNAHLSTPTPKLPQDQQTIPRKLVRLIESLLSKSPHHRPASASDVAEALEEFAKGADLKSLATNASNLGSHSELLKHNELPRHPSKRSTQWWMMHTPRYTAIATGFFGLLIGFLLGVIITIRYPDGTMAQVEAPEGSQISIESNNEPQSQLPLSSGLRATGTGAYQELPNALPVIEEYAPLAFSVLHARTMDQEALERAKAAFLSLPRLDAPVEYLVREEGIWLPADESVDDPSIVVHRGQRYVLVSRKQKDRLRWSQLAGNIKYAQGTSRTVDVGFTEEFAQHLEAFTESHMDQPLAFIANNRVVSAPIIRGKLGRQAQITGDFNPSDFAALFSALNGVALEPNNPLTRRNQPELPGLPSSSLRESQSEPGPDDSLPEDDQLPTLQKR